MTTQTAQTWFPVEIPMLYRPILSSMRGTLFRFHHFMSAIVISGGTVGLHGIKSTPTPLKSLAPETWMWMPISCSYHVRMRGCDFALPRPRCRLHKIGSAPSVDNETYRPSWSAAKYNRDGRWMDIEGSRTFQRRPERCQINNLI